MTAEAHPPGEPVVADVDSPVELERLLTRWGLGGRPVLVSVGGAGSMGEDALRTIEVLLADHVLPLLHDLGAVVVDGGTDAGVMAAMGRARQEKQDVDLVGVVARGTVHAPGTGSGPDAATLDPQHSHQVLVPGDSWGDESPWISRVAGAISAGRASVTLVGNGGGITLQDIDHSLRAGRPVVVLAGSGRTADLVAAARDDPAQAEPRVRALAGSPLLHVVPVDDAARLTGLLRRLLSDTCTP